MAWHPVQAAGFAARPDCTAKPCLQGRAMQGSARAANTGSTALGHLCDELAVPLRVLRPLGGMHFVGPVRPTCMVQDGKF